MRVSDYKQLKVWQKGIEIVDRVHSLTDKFPREELDTQSIIANRRRYMTDKDLNELAEELDHDARMLANLINRVDSGTSDERRGPSDDTC